MWLLEEENENRRAFLAEQIAQTINTMACCEIMHIDDNISEVSGGVEYFFSEHGLHSYCQDIQNYLPFFCKALASVGEIHTCQKVIVFGTGIVKRLEYLSVSGKAVWILDLKRMLSSDYPVIELSLYSALNIVLDTVAVVWHEKSGDGFLGLRQLYPVALEITGGYRKRHHVYKLIEEIKTICELKLLKIKSQRDWMSVPRIIDMDIFKPRVFFYER